MAVIFKWRQPKEAAEREWKELAAQLRQLARVWVKWTLIIFPPFLYVIYRISPDTTLRVAKGLFMAEFGFPALFYLQMRVNELFGGRYEIGEKGLYARTSGSSSEFIRWRDIEAFCVLNDSNLPCLRVLEFKANRYKKWRKWNFDSATVDEMALISFLDRHLPGKRQGTGELSRPPG
jgi:hypothetical protein